jgi:hypothetical protein
MSKKCDEHALDFAIHQSRFLGLGEFGLPCTAHAFFSQRLSNHI